MGGLVGAVPRGAHTLVAGGGVFAEGIGAAGAPQG